MSRLGLAFALTFLVLACDAQDPGVEGLTRGEFKEAGPSEAAPPADAAKDGASDAGDGSAGTTVFGNAGTFQSTQPTTTAVQYHNNGMVGVTPGKNQDCLSCHKMGGAGPVFLFAGTLFSDMAGTTPAAGKEVRVLGTDGKGFSAHSDSDGNFWYEPGTGESIAFPAQSGARDGTTTALMVGALTSGGGSSCNANGCHDGTTQAYLHLP